MEKQKLGWTDLSQSKELLKAGLDPNCADLYYKYDYNMHKHEDVVTQANKEDWQDPYNKDVPAWSLGALIDIIPDSIKKGDVSFQFHSTFNIVDRFAACYEDSSYKRQIMCRAWNNPIELYVHIIVWLLEEGFIEKQK